MSNRFWHRRTLIVTVIVALALVMALAACGDDDSDGDNSSDQPSGELSISNAWVRASIPMESSMDEGDAESEDSESDSEAMGATDESDHSTAGAVTGAFMLIENSTGTAERLVSASVSEDIASVVEIHETTLDENDVMQMRPVEGIEVPANGSVELKPGGYHIMLIDLQNALNPGDTVMLTLTFESGTTLSVDAEVREMSS